MSKLWAWLGFWGLAFAQNQAPALPPLQGVYIGFMDNQAIVAQFSSEEVISGRYYLRSKGLDIHLEGSFGNQQYTLEERYPQQSLGTWQLRQQKNGVGQTLLVGSRKVGTRSQGLVLRPIDRRDLVSPLKLAVLEGWKYSDPYLYLKFDLPLQAGRRIRYGRMAFRWYTEPKSGIQLVRLEGQYRVNSSLEVEHLRLAAKALRCNAGKGSGWQQQTQVAWLTARTLSLQAYTTVACDPGITDRFPSSLNFNLRTGQKLALEDMYRVVPVPKGFDPQQDPALSFEHFGSYLHQRNRALVTLAVLSNPRAKLNPLCWGEESGLEPTDIVNTDSWYFSRLGLVFQIDFPQGLNACDLELTIPYTVLQRGG